jgi:hypothetical protein
MIWSNDSASPGAHKYIIAIIHTIANCAISNAFLTPLKLLKESEVPGNCSQQGQRLSFTRTEYSFFLPVL